MDYEAIVTQALTLLRREQRLSYRVLKLRLQLDDETLEALQANKPATARPIWKPSATSPLGRKSLACGASSCCGRRCRSRRRKSACTRPSLWLASSRRNRWSCTPRGAWRACGSSRASALKPTTCWRRSMAGSRRGLRRQTSRRQRHCSKRVRDRASKACSRGYCLPIYFCVMDTPQARDRPPDKGVEHTRTTAVHGST